VIEQCSYAADAVDVSIVCYDDSGVHRHVQQLLCSCVADAADAHSATGTGEDMERSGLTTYTAPVRRRSLAIVLTEDGAAITADTMKTSPLSAIMILVKEVRVLPVCKLYIDMKYD